MLSGRRIFTRFQSSSLFTLSQYSTNAKTKYVVSENARPFEEVPGPTTFQLIRGVLPGGIFHGHSLKEFSAILRKQYGDLLKIPGTFGVPCIVMSFNPDHFEKVLRTEGVWPFRRPLGTFSHFREILQKDFYGEYQGLANS